MLQFFFCFLGLCENNLEENTGKHIRKQEVNMSCQEGNEL